MPPARSLSPLLSNPKMYHYWTRLIDKSQYIVRSPGPEQSEASTSSRLGQYARAFRLGALTVDLAPGCTFALLFSLQPSSYAPSHIYRYTHSIASIIIVLHRSVGVPWFIFDLRSFKPKVEVQSSNEEHECTQRQVTRTSKV